MSDWLHGRTASGREVRIPEDPYTTDSPVFINGLPVELVAPPSGMGSVQRRRDGGTTRIYTVEGVIYRPTPLKPDLRPKLDDEELEPA